MEMLNLRIMKWLKKDERQLGKGVLMLLFSFGT
jgi:hypothetical protein